MELPRDAFSRFVSTVRAERYLLLWRPDGGPFQVVAAKGLDAKRVLTTEPVSLRLFEEVAATNQPSWSELEGENDSTTFMLSGIKSYVCVPLRLPGGTALFYADFLKSMAGLSFTDFVKVQNLAQQCNPARLSAPPRPAPPPAKRPAEPAAEPAAPEAAGKNPPLTLTQQAHLFRCLAAFVEAGIPLLRGLHGLSDQGESPVLRNCARSLHDHVLRGGDLSTGLRRSRFDEGVVPLLRVAERTGKLAAVFRLLAEHLDQKVTRRMRLRAALTYPAVVLVFGVAMALTLPTWILADHLRAYARNGPLPWPTQVLLEMSSPWFWLALAAFLLLAYRYLFRARFLKRLPGLALVHSANLEVTLATTLALQLEVGVPLLTALEVALEASGEEEALAAAPTVLECLRQGEPLSRALREVPGLRPTFLAMLVAGEESGLVSKCLQWSARLSKLEFDQSLETAARLLEPVAMLVLGVLVGFIAVASLLPTLQSV